MPCLNLSKTKQQHLPGIIMYPLSTDAYREELAKVQLSEEEALGLLQDVSWQVTELSLQIIHSCFSSIHHQKLS